MRKSENESAVSEVIGVVLIVAITVILASIIAAYTFGMMSEVPLTRTIAVTATQTDQNMILVTYRGGPDQAILSNLSIIWPDNTHQLVDFPKVGDVYKATNIGSTPNATPGKDHVVVTAIFKNNVQQVALESFV
jgi:hypothetical protein